MVNLKVLEYELIFDLESRRSITLQCKRYHTGERWSINDGSMCLGKTPDKAGYYTFGLEVLPSSRDDDYYREYRFDTAEDAYGFWVEHRDKIIATPAERRAYYHKIRTGGE